MAWQGKGDSREVERVQPGLGATDSGKPLHLLPRKVALAQLEQTAVDELAVLLHKQ